MATIRDAGFIPVRVATNVTLDMKLAGSGSLRDGRVVIVASTPAGEGWTEFATTNEATKAFNDICRRARLTPA